MNYELAKKLKDVGFPQESTWTEENQLPSRYYELKGKTIRYRHIENDDGVKISTLSELIEACGDRFFSLMFDGGMWIAEEFRKDKQQPRHFKGKTPEEAVANLWLELNK